jgi:hypothetical protein
VKQEWARTIRTTIQVMVGLIPAMPALIPALGLNATVGVGASILATSAVLTRLMQVPAVDRLVQKFLRSQ